MINNKLTWQVHPYTTKKWLLLVVHYEDLRKGPLRVSLHYYKRKKNQNYCKRIEKRPPSVDPKSFVVYHESSHEISHRHNDRNCHMVEQCHPCRKTYGMLSSVYGNKMGHTGRNTLLGTADMRLFS